jgi:hypothetical protein
MESPYIYDFQSRQNHLSVVLRVYKDAFVEKTIQQKQLLLIPIFIDFAFVYYLRGYDDQSPIRKLPIGLTKFNMIMNLVNAPKDRLYEIFTMFITNEFIAEIRQENPPFYLMTDLTEEEVDYKLTNVVQPLFKELLDSIVKL